MAGGLTMSYDEENRMVQAVNSSSTTETDVYNPSGQLVYRQQGSATPEVYMYGPQGQRMRFGVVWPSWSDMNVVLLLYEDQELHFAGKLLETDDRLGTSVVAPSGWTAKTYPYGELREALPSNAGGRYATYLLDSTTNLNYAVHRWYSSQVARFTTVDPSGSASPGSPQSWNQYAYVMGDPVNHYDPAGTFSCGPGDPCPAELCWDEYGGEYIGWFTTCLGEGATNSMGRPGEVKPTPQQRKLEWWKKKLHDVLQEANRLLLTNDCAAFLGAGVADPYLILQGLTATHQYGAISFGAITPEPGTVTSATTVVASSAPVDIGNGAQQLPAQTVNITLNTLAGNFVSGSLYDEGVTLLHEIGHTIYDLFGPLGTRQLGSQYPIQPDAHNVKASEANTNAVEKHCH